MTPRIPVRFNRLGRRRVPTLDIRCKLDTGAARVREFAIVDTGSAFTILSERLLHQNRFPVHAAKKSRRPVQGLGGEVDIFYLENAILALTDTDNALHPINLPRLFFTKTMHPPILGRETLRLFNATVNIDFGEERGHVDVG